jgi:hypothetical protein
MYAAIDAIEYLMSSTGGGAQDQEHRVLRQSLFHAYRDLVSVRDWDWYHAVEHVPLAGMNQIITHTLPWGVSSVDAITLPTTNLVAEYVRPTEWERLIASKFRSLVRIVWTVLPSKTVPDRWDLKVFNGWSYDTEATLTYRRRPRDLRFTGWEPQARSGTVTVDGPAVYGTDTQFSKLMVGSLVRLSSDPTKHPESLAGMNGYSDEALIYNVLSSTEIAAWSPGGNIQYQNTRYIITDYLDISPQMYTALLSGSEAWLARLTGKNIEGAMGVYGRDLRLAFENDVKAPLSGRRETRYGYYSYWYLRPGADNSGGSGGSSGSGTTSTTSTTTLDGGTPTSSNPILDGGTPTSYP